MRIGLQRTAWLLAAGWGLTAIVASSSRALAGDGDTPAVVNTVNLEIEISGLAGKGGKVTIKPAHPGCQFKAISVPLEKRAGGDMVKLAPITVAASTTSADRDCSFEITVTEPGREPKTIRRGIRLNPPVAGAKVAPSRTLKCSMSATAIAIKDAGKSTTPRR
jgi:hypothetical protein